MARYIADKNSIGFFYESGTYAAASGTIQSIGLVQSHTPDDNTNVISTRYIANDTRNVGQFNDGALDHTGTITYYPQDWKMLGFALGSTVDTGSPSPYQHNLNEANSDDGYAFVTATQFPSFTIETAQVTVTDGSHFVRTYNGAMIDSYTLNVSQGEIVSCDVNYVAQSVAFSSGDPSSVSVSTNRPFLWSDVEVNIPSGTVLTEVKTIGFTVNNNIDAPHYVNGSRQVGLPQPINRDYELTLEIDASAAWSKPFYDQYFIGGSTFNVLLKVADSSAGAGSRDMFMSLSGCKVMDMEAPETIEGINSQTITIAPRTASVIVNDTIQLYNPY